MCRLHLPCTLLVRGCAFWFCIFVAGIACFLRDEGGLPSGWSWWRSRSRSQTASPPVCHMKPFTQHPWVSQYLLLPVPNLFWSWRQLLSSVQPCVSLLSGQNICSSCIYLFPFFVEYMFIKDVCLVLFVTFRGRRENSVLSSKDYLLKSDYVATPALLKFEILSVAACWSVEIYAGLVPLAFGPCVVWSS